MPPCIHPPRLRVLLLSRAQPGADTAYSPAAKVSLSTDHLNILSFSGRTCSNANLLHVLQGLHEGRDELLLAGDNLGQNAAPVGDIKPKTLLDKFVTLLAVA